jgi:hypothetical protein
MARSGSIDYTRTSYQIVQEALELIGVVGAQETPAVSDVTFATSRLNAMVKAWQAEGLHLWGTTEGVIFLTEGTNRYDVSSAATSVNSCLFTDFIHTQLSADEAAAQTTLSVDSSTGFTTSDKIGVVLDSGVVHWSTIASIPTSTSVTINNALPTQAATNANVFVYTSRITRPLRIINARRVSGYSTAQSETTVEISNREEYFNTPSKNTAGDPVMLYYDPQLDTGSLYVWPTPDDSNVFLRVTYERSLEDFDESTNTPDFPQEWLEPLTYNLAYRIAPAFGRSGDSLQDIRILAALTKEAAKQFDREITSLRIVPYED